MTLILVQTVFQSILSTLHWLGFYAGIQALDGPKTRKWIWTLGSAIFAFALLLGILLLASDNFFRPGETPPRIPLVLAGTLLLGYLLLLSDDFRAIIASIPPHWLIAIQTSRVFGAIFLIRWWQGQAPAVFAIPAGVGDILTGLFAPLVAYWWVARKPYARTAAIAWNLFGMADLINAVTLGVVTGGGGGGIVFPIVLIPIYAVPRAFLVHSYSLIGLLREPSRHSAARESLRYGIETART